MLINMSGIQGFISKGSSSFSLTAYCSVYLLWSVIVYGLAQVVMLHPAWKEMMIDDNLKKYLLYF